MKQRQYINNTIFFLSIIILLLPFATASVQLIDVDTQGTACIFDVNGKVAVVNEKDTKTVNGYRIWVKQAYPLNSQAKDEDKCDALISFVGGPTVETMEEQTVVVEKKTEEERETQEFELETQEKVEIQQVREPTVEEQVEKNQLEPTPELIVAPTQKELKETNPPPKPSFFQKILSYFKAIFI